MGYIILVAVVIGAILLLKQLRRPRIQDALILATPFGAYMRARDRGAPPAAAMMEGIRGLRYREPWKSISDGDLIFAIGVLASARTTEPFKQFILAIERSRNPHLAQDPNFVVGLLGAEQPSETPAASGTLAAAMNVEPVELGAEINDEWDEDDEDDEDESFEDDEEVAEASDDVAPASGPTTSEGGANPRKAIASTNEASWSGAGTTTQTFVLALEDGLARLETKPPAEQLKYMASMVLVPLEYETLNRIPCPRCGGQDWTREVQQAHGASTSEEWPYDCPCGDTITRRCNACDHRHVATFWFRADAT